MHSEAEGASIEGECVHMSQIEARFAKGVCCWAETLFIDHLLYFSGHAHVNTSTRVLEHLPV